LRKSNPEQYVQESYQAIAEHCRGILKLMEKGAICFDYGNNL